MSNSVLFDVAGPRARARTRLYSLVALLFVAALAALVLWQVYRTGEFAYAKWEPFVTPSFIVALLVDGLLTTLSMAVSSILFAVVFGAVFGIGKLSDRVPVRWFCWTVVEFFRAVPLLLLITFIFFTYGVGDGIGSYWSVVIGLTLYNGSVLAEVFRAGINAVPKGQAEAAYALGMRKSQVMMTILMPQGVKVMLPAIISQMVVALKDTSLGAYVVAPGLTKVGAAIYGQFNNQLQTAVVIAAMYILTNLALSRLATLAQRKLLGEHAAAPADEGATATAG